MTHSTYPPPRKRLTRSSQDRMIAGVCGGLARYLNMDATLVRILVALLTVFSLGTIGVVGYVVAVLVMPEDTADSVTPGAPVPTPTADPGPPPVFTDDPVHPDPADITRPPGSAQPDGGQPGSQPGTSEPDSGEQDRNRQQEDDQFGDGTDHRPPDLR